MAKLISSMSSWNRHVEIKWRPRKINDSKKETTGTECTGYDRGRSTRKVANTLDVSYWTVWKIFKDSLFLYLYHIQHVRALLSSDFPPHIELCQQILQTLVRISQFFEQILFTNEAIFSRNFYNNHIWADKNPHGVYEDLFNHQFSMNIWVWIVGDYLIGSVFLLQRFTGKVYRNFMLEETLPEFLEDILLTTRVWLLVIFWPQQTKIAALVEVGHIHGLL